MAKLHDAPPHNHFQLARAAKTFGEQYNIRLAFSKFQSLVTYCRQKNADCSSVQTTRTRTNASPLPIVYEIYTNKPSEGFFLCKVTKTSSRMGRGVYLQANPFYSTRLLGDLASQYCAAVSHTHSVVYCSS